MIRALLLVAGLTLLPVHAQTPTARERVDPEGPYRSQVRVLDELPETTDPLDQVDQTQGYARALLLRQLASQAIAAGDNEAAIDRLEQALSLQSLAPLATQQMQANLGQLYAAAGRYDEAVATLTSTVTSGLQDAQLLMVLATSALQTGQYEIALDAVREALDASNNPPGDWIETGVYSAWQAGDLNTAIGWQRQLLDRDGNNEKAWRRLAALYSENERYGMAAATLTAALQSGVIADDQTRLQLGNLLQRAGTPAIAATWVADVVTRRADDANLLQWLVQLQLDAHDDRAALESLYRYAGMRNDPATWLQVGELALTVNDERAIAALRKASADRAPGGVRGRALLLLGQALVERDNFAAARRAFTAATEYGGTTYRLAQQWLDRLPTGPVASPADNLEMQTANNVAEPVLATVDTKTVPPLRAYSARMASSPATMTADAAQLARELVRITRREKLEWTGPLTVVIDGDVSDLQQALEVEVAVPIRRVAPARGNFAASRLPPLNCAWMRYEGPWSGLETAWQELHAATLAAGHQLSGQARQVILHRAPEGRDSIVELQIGILSTGS